MIAHLPNLKSLDSTVVPLLHVVTLLYARGWYDWSKRRTLSDGKTKQATHSYAGYNKNKTHTDGVGRELGCGFRFILEVRDTQDNEGETTANGVDSR